ncbi:hypothetical protein HU200_002320 [Digitaria exilis]|uniref:Uncharacterized protein n=1 Tax=Digitaria exilis TaxID=1010633 RepID=A0A835KZD1_9POAL|nr:hypothetical protein HU200_002320 [Digitaria exilis]
MADDAEVAGFPIPAGTKVIVNLYAIMRDPEFVLERFVGVDMDFRSKTPGSTGRAPHAFEWRLPDGVQPGDVDIRYRFGTSLNKAVLVPVASRLSVSVTLPTDASVRFCWATSPPNLVRRITGGRLRLEIVKEIMPRSRLRESSLLSPLAAAMLLPPPSPPLLDHQSRCTPGCLAVVPALNFHGQDLRPQMKEGQQHHRFILQLPTSACVGCRFLLDSSYHPPVRLKCMARAMTLAADSRASNGVVNTTTQCDFRRQRRRRDLIHHDTRCTPVFDGMPVWNGLTQKVPC